MIVNNRKRRLYGLKKDANLILSGGGIKGIAYIGMLKESERHGYNWVNIAGVSAGALVGSFTASRYNPDELYAVLENFDFKKIDNNRLFKQIPVLEKIFEDFSGKKTISDSSFTDFLTQESIISSRLQRDFDSSVTGTRGNFFKNIITYSNESSMLNGDLLEDWVYTSLAKKGVKTFADLRTGICDAVNPNGYKIRMTAVDANRAKVIVLPDDMVYYGINPDSFSVAKAVRMSTSVPFAFKPVEMNVNIGGRDKVYYFVDGGVLDNFPYWLVEDYKSNVNIGFKLVSNDSKNKLFSIDTPLKILKALLSICHDIGIPKNKKRLKYVGAIQTGKISFLDFDLSEEEKQYLVNEGIKASQKLFSTVDRAAFL